MEIGLLQNAGYRLALVTLDFNLAVLDRATRSARALHGLGKLLLFRQANADKILYYGHGLATAPGFHA